MSSSTLTVLAAGALTTIQDHGRPGLAHLGVARAGPLDDRAADLANRLVGNRPGTALLETTLGRLRVRPDHARWVAVTGAPVEVTVDGRPAAFGEAVRVPAGAVLDLGTPTVGVRTYVAVAGGLAVEPVLGSRSTDTLAWVGPPRVTDGTRLPLGPPAGPPRAHDTPRPAASGPLRITPGPREDWLVADAVRTLCRAAYTVTADSNRIGLRLRGAGLAWRPPGERSGDELPSEGMVLGAVQVPPDGQPVVFLADHPTTGGYPVVAVVDPADLWQCGQLRPGEEVRFSPAPAPGAATG